MADGLNSVFLVRDKEDFDPSSSRRPRRRVALEIALVKCICKLTAYNGAHSELVSSGSMVSSIRVLAKRLGQMHPRSSTLTALTVAVAQRV